MAKEWLKAASDDLLVIENIIENDTLTHMTAFHAQQAIEKSFKAVLELKEMNVPKKHDLLVLYGLISAFVKTLNEDTLDQLNSLYIDSRYPGELGLLPDGKPTLEEAKEFYEFAKNVYNIVKEFVDAG